MDIPLDPQAWCEADGNSAGVGVKYHYQTLMLHVIRV